MKKILSVVALVASLGTLHAGDAAAEAAAAAAITKAFLTTPEATGRFVAPPPIRGPRRGPLLGSATDGEKARVNGVKTQCQAVVQMAQPFFAVRGQDVSGDAELIISVKDSMGSMKAAFLAALGAASTAIANTQQLHTAAWAACEAQSDPAILRVISWSIAIAQHQASA